MRILPAAYINASKEKVRDVFVQIKLKDAESTVLTMDKLYPIDIKRTITDGSFGVGFSSSDRIAFATATTEKIAKRTRITLYNSFGGDYERLGRFYCEESVRNGNILEVTAFDAMNILRARTVKFTGIPSKEIPELAFPCKIQDVLDYVVAKNGLTCNFTCEDFTVNQKPMKNETEYYSDAEILGFIASAHARNAKFDYEGELVFVGFSQVDVEFSADDVIDMTIDDSEPFEVTGILFTVGDDAIYIDDVPGSEYDEEAAGVIKIENPLASVEIAEYVWSQLGGLKYYGGSLTVRGSGLLECGDVITVKNLKDPTDETEYPLCITSISYSIDSGGFVEKISSDVSKSKGKSLSSGTSSGGGGGGGAYYAGQGLSLKNSTFSLNVANQADIGGIRIAGTENVSADDPSAEYGIFKKTYDGFPALRTALSYQKGGFFLGDGFVPELEEEEKYGETYFSPNGYVHLRLGDGLEFIDNDEAASDPKEVMENSTGGRKVAVKVDGQTVKLNDNGQLSAEGYAEGAAIAFRTADKQKSINVKYDDVTLKVNGGDLAVNIDNDTIKVNDDGKLASIGVTIENGIVIKEADAKLLLHEYTEVEYVQGNRIVYGGPYNQIIVNGYICYAYQGIAPNGVTLDNITTENASLLPDIPMYTYFEFNESPHLYYTGTGTAYKNFEVKYVSMDSSGISYSDTYLKEDGTIFAGTAYKAYSGYGMGCAFLWRSIIAPGSVQYNRTFPYGGVLASRAKRYKSSATKYTFVLDSTWALPFASEAEYNAAVGLTYEPITLTNVEETVTEV